MSNVQCLPTFKGGADLLLPGKVPRQIPRPRRDLFCRYLNRCPSSDVSGSSLGWWTPRLRGITPGEDPRTQGCLVRVRLLKGRECVEPSELRPVPVPTKSLKICKSHLVSKSICLRIHECTFKGHQIEPLINSRYFVRSPSRRRTPPHWGCVGGCLLETGRTHPDPRESHLLAK